MPSRFYAAINNALMKAHKHAGKIVSGIRTYTPHARKGLSTLADLATYVGRSGIHPYLTLGATAVATAARFGAKALDAYTPALNDFADRYPPTAPQITENGISFASPMPLISTIQ